MAKTIGILRKIKIYCIFCKTTIYNPSINRITCGSKECTNLCKNLHKDFWCILNPIKYRKYHREYDRKHKKWQKKKHWQQKDLEKP